MSVTAKELAQKLGISATAVSMALNNKAGVSTETRARIIRAAEEYGYDFTKVKHDPVLPRRPRPPLPHRSACAAASFRAPRNPRSGGSFLSKSPEFSSPSAHVYNLVTLHP